MGFLFRFLLRNLKGYRLLLPVALVVTFLEVQAALGGLIVQKYLLDKVVSKQDPAAPYSTILNLIDPVKSGQLHSLTATLVFLIIMLIVLGALDAVLSYGQQFIATYIAQNLSARLRKNLFDQLQRLSLDWHGKQKKGDLIQRITGDIANIEKLITDGLVDLLGGILTIITAIVLMIQAQIELTLISVVILPALFVIILTYTRGIKAAAKRASKAVGQVADVATEDVGAITVLKAFSLEDREATRFNRYVGKSREAGLEAGVLQAQFTPVVNILITVGTAIIIGVGGFALANGKFPIINVQASPPVTAGTLLLFLSLLKQLYQPMKAFENVIFGYTADRPILKGINLHIAAGKKVALVGLSGGGKTTLVKLIPRFYETQQGSLKIDGLDNRNYPLSLLRRNVSQVLQDSVLFEGTILENIKIGRPEATMEEIVEAAKQAHIHETILDLPDGYETKVRERGKNFSGGQRQRLAIARAILCDSPILILDEPTAALDVEAEVEVLRAIDTLVVGRTVLMISHRLSTLGNVDEIIVLKDGQIVEQGTYKELKRKDGVFAGLLKEQNRYNVDYAGASVIVPQAELMKMLKQHGQKVASSSPVIAPVSTPEPVLASPAKDRRVKEISSNGNGRQMLNARVLVEVDGKVVGQRQLNKDTLTVGRLASNDVPVPSSRVSRLHARIRWDEINGTWLIEDAESLNGLTFQGQRVDRHTLGKGDRIYISPTAVIQYEPV